MIYPEYIEVDGKRYKLNTSYQAALRCFKVMQDPDITDSERGMAIMVLLIDKIVIEESEKVLELLVRYLQRGSTSEEIKSMMALTDNQDRDIDYEQDMGYITASFMSDYHIDLSDPKNDRIHWWQFVDLLNGVNPKSALGRVRELRNMDPSDYQDPKTRDRIIKAKSMVAIKERLNSDEQRAEDEFMARLSGSKNRERR